MTVNLQNTSLSQASSNLFITFDYDDKLYNFRKTHIKVPMLVPGLNYSFDTFIDCLTDKGVSDNVKVPMLVPGLNYSFDTFIDCLTDKGVSDNVKVYVLKEGRNIPIITGVISMPVSETVVVT